jgi:hypothetical protein
VKRLPPILLVLATLLCFCRLFRAEFTLLDDAQTVQHNPRLNPPTLEHLRSYWPPIRSGKVNHEFGLYMPMTYTFWSGIATVAQTHSSDPLYPNAMELNPYLFHAANVVLHALSGLIVFAISRELVKSDWPAFFGAAVFLFHPVQVEAVAWVSGAKDLLAGLFSLLAIWRYMRFATSGRKSDYAIALSSFTAALLSKPSAVTVPLILLALDFLALRRPWRRVVSALGAWFFLAALCAVIGRFAQPATEVPTPPLWARPFIVGDSLAFYLWKLLWPLHLGFDYGRRPAVIMPHAWFYLTWLVPISIAIVLWRMRARWPLICAGALIFALAPLPTLGFLKFLFQQYSTTANHYLYVAMFGVAMIVAAALAQIRTKSIWIAATLIVIAFGLLSMIQTGHWLDDRALFTHMANVNPQSCLAHSNLAVLAVVEQKDDEAKREIDLAFQSQPMSPERIAFLEKLQRDLNGASTKPAP